MNKMQFTFQINAIFGFKFNIMQLSTLDWAIVLVFFIVSIAIGIITSKKASNSSEDFFLSGRNTPWWLLGVSMVATTFAADTPGLITDIIRKENSGVYGNWAWWSMLLTGVLTVFFYAKLWRKSGINTDLEFYELRYSGKAASYLRGFRAIYLGVIFNVITMAGVCLAGNKIGHVLFGLQPYETLLIAGFITVVYSSLGGLKSVLLTDFFQFIIAMIGSIWATIYIVNIPEIGGIDKLLSHPAVQEKMSFFPDFSDTELITTMLVIPLAVQWWSTWYPGAEPGGGGYIAQRMLAAKNEKHATWAVLFFNFAHYALRPWPWIIVGLASIVIFPTLDSLQVAFPDLDSSYIKHDLAYSAMLKYLPAGLLGIVATSLIAAFMSTLSTQLNWGASYIVNDFYKRFVNPDSTNKEDVRVGRIATGVLMLLAGGLSLIFETAKDVFDLMLLIGAGTGLLFILRWFWKRINPYSEIAAMAISFLIAFIFFINTKFELNLFDITRSEQLILSVAITTIGWLIVTLITQPTDSKTLEKFEKLIFTNEKGEIVKFDNFKFKILAFFITTIGIYSALFGIGNLVYKTYDLAILCFSVFSATLLGLYLMRKRIF